MTPKPVRLRSAAELDIDDAIEFMMGQGAIPAALAFIDALETAFERIADHPALGSARLAHELDLPGLRSWPLAGYPYLLLYVEMEHCIDVWRVLHGHRDIPPTLRA
jgi:toxin ParE1/3/4